MEDDMSDDEIVMYLIVRSSLGMPKGKIAAQVGHGVQLIIRAIEAQGGPRDKLWLEEWELQSYTKLVLKADDEEFFKPRSAFGRYVVDEGRTAVEAGSRTVYAMAPMPKSRAAPYVEGLKLL
jgi:peptidyl-tRNA hydrolase, PTH2 family